MKKPFNILITAANPDLFGNTLKRLQQSGASISGTKGSLDVLRREFKMNNLTGVSTLDEIPDSIGSVKIGAIKTPVLLGILTDGQDETETTVLGRYFAPICFDMVIIEPYDYNWEQGAFDNLKVDMSPVLLIAACRREKALPITTPQQLDKIADYLLSSEDGTVPEDVLDVLWLQATKFVAGYYSRIAEAKQRAYYQKHGVSEPSALTLIFG